MSQNQKAPTITPPHRILMIVESAAGGTGRHVLDLSNGLMARGHDVHLIYSTGRVDRLFLDRLAQLPQLQHLALPMRTTPHPSDLAVVVAVRRYMRQHGPFDALHGHSSKGGAIARLAALGTRAQAFYTLHGLIMMDPLLPRWKWLMYLGIERILALRTARIIAVSPEEGRAAAGLGFRKIALVPNGLGRLELTPRADARRELKLMDEHVVVGFVGRLVEQKAPEVLVGGFAQAAAAVPHARLAVVGDGPLRASLMELAGQLDVADKILWLGERDARTVLAAFDAFALSSRKEGLPYVILEAMAAGLPIVATTSAGVEILVEPNVSGAVCPPDDARAFGDAIQQVIGDAGRLAAYARASFERSKLFTLDAMVEGTLGAYRGQSMAG